jgi:hypothetical protein
MPLSKNPEFAGTAMLPAGVMVPTLPMPVTGVQAARLLGRELPLAYLPRRAGGAADRLWLRAPSAAFTHADTVYAFIGEAPGPGMEFVTTWMPLEPHHCSRQSQRSVWRRSRKHSSAHADILAITNRLSLSTELVGSGGVLVWRGV